MGGSIAGGQSKGKSDLVVTESPGIFGGGKNRAKTRDLGYRLEDILRGIGTGSDIGSAYQQELLKPSFGPRSEAETALLNEISSLTQGASALRGLGPSTQGALAQNIAPTLLQFRQQRLGELGGGAEFEVARRQQAIQGLLELIGMASPQAIAGQKQRQKSFDASLAFKGGAASAAK